MKTTNKLICLALPLILLGCQTFSPGRSSVSPLSMGNDNSTVSLAARPQAAVEIPPTADTTITAPEAKGAIISAQPIAQAEQPAQFGGLTLSVRWPQQPEAVRRTQVIPTSANSLWVKVYSGVAGGTATGSAAPEGSILASRVVGRGISDQVPGASPTPCCQQQGDERSTVYMSLPPGSVTVWVGTFAEGPTEVSTSSVFLSSAQKAFTILANKLTTGASLNLAGNPEVAPAITGVSPAYVAPGQTFTITGKNFGMDAEAVKVNLYQAGGCQNCGPQLYALTVNSASSSSISVSVPATTGSQQFQLQIEAAGFKVVGGSVGVLDKNNLQLTFDNTAKTWWNNSNNEYITAKGAKVTVTGLTGWVCCTNGNDRIDLPLSYVTVKAPGGATMSLDASGSFPADSLGKYDVISNVGEAKNTQKVSAYNVKAAVRVGDWDQNTDPNNKKYMVMNLADYVAPPCQGCGYSEPIRLRYWIQDGVFVDGAGEQVSNAPGFTVADFIYSASSEVNLDTSERVINPVAAGVATVTATLKMSPSQVSTATASVFAASGVEWTSGNTTLVQGNGSYWHAQVAFTAPGTPAKLYMGGDSDFNYTSSANSVAQVQEYGYVTGQTVGSADITATLKKNGTFVATRSVTVTLP